MKKAFLTIALWLGLSMGIQAQPSIAVHFHDPDNLATHIQLVHQVDQINEIFRGSLEFRFASEDESYAHRGKPDELNVGIVSSSSYYGITNQFPWESLYMPLEDDFILLDKEALKAPFSGVVLGHEIGHWLGLFHSSTRGNCMNVTSKPRGCKFALDQISIMLYFSRTLR